MGLFRGLHEVGLMSRDPIFVMFFFVVVQYIRKTLSGFGYKIYCVVLKGTVQNCYSTVDILYCIFQCHVLLLYSISFFYSVLEFIDSEFRPLSVCLASISSWCICTHIVIMTCVMQHFVSHFLCVFVMCQFRY